jgi:hypothetical protein
MTPQIRALLVTVAILGGGVVIWTAAPGVTQADLQAAGIGACVTRERDCTVRDEPGGASICPDAGRYCRKTIALKVCNELDGGKAVIMKPAHAAKVGDDSAWCGPHRPSVLADGTVQDVAFECACSTGANCTWAKPLMGGGTQNVPAPTGMTMAAGTWSGAGCRPKPCVGLALTDGGVPYDETWPGACPP